ncbi:MAG: metallophosphoesterase [Planctomycetota bacterium]|jgi:predicted MPP superfamily phosphohydrolase
MIFVHLCWLLILSIGNTELLVTLINRTHALPVHERLLKPLRHLHDILIPLVPLWILVFVGFISPGVFVKSMTPREAWSQLSAPVAGYFGLCLIGFAGFLFSVMRYWLRRVPRQQISFESQIVDVTNEVGVPLAGNGTYRSLLRVPFNECFTVEWTEREFRLPGLPREWDGLTVLHLTDLHFTGTPDLPFYETICDRAKTLDFDIAVFTGDLIDDENCLDWIPRTLGQIEAPLGQYYILGNHDWYHEVPAVRQELTAAGWRDLGGQVQVLDTAGKKLAIGGDERPWLGKAPNFTAAPPDAFRLLLSHTPDNLSWARRQGVDLMLAGHNHGGQVVLPGIGPVYSPSFHGTKFAGGLYWHTPTLLFVSRGLGGRHPLRIGARPEVSRITLRSSD